MLANTTTIIIIVNCKTISVDTRKPEITQQVRITERYELFIGGLGVDEPRQIDGLS